MDYEDVTVVAGRPDQYLLAPTDIAEEGFEAPMFMAVIYDERVGAPLFEKMLSFDAIAKMGYWNTEDLPSSEELLTDDQLKRLGDSDFGTVLGDPPVPEESRDTMVPRQPEESLDWLHYDYSWDEGIGRFVDSDGNPMDFSASGSVISNEE